MTIPSRERPSPPNSLGPSAADMISTRIGPELVLRLAAALRTASTHGVENQVFRRHAQSLFSAAAPLFADGELTLAVASDYLHLNGTRIQATPTHLAIHNKMMADFQRFGIGGLIFMQMPLPGEFGRLVQILLDSGVPRSYDAISQKLTDEGVESIQVLEQMAIEAGHGSPGAASAVRDEDPPSRDRRLARTAHENAVSGFRSLLRNARRDRHADIRKGQRIVQPLVDCVIRHQYSIVGLTALKKHDDYTCAHSVNVAILAIATGNALGLSRGEIAELGVSALLHDLGKTEVPVEVLRKPGRLDDSDWKAIRNHPFAGARLIARIPGLSSLMLDAMQVCLEHHIAADGSGYPRAMVDPPQSPMARIVSVVDCYDALTSHRAYRKRAYAPVQALQYMQSLAGAQFDGVVIRALVRAVGVYPAGSWIVTASGRTALVVSPNPLDPTHPNCLVVDPSAPATETGPGVAEAWTPMPPGETVVRVLDPDDYPMEPERLLAA